MYTSERFKEAARKAGDAYQGITRPGDEKPVYSSTYSYRPEHIRIPEGTPVAPCMPLTSNDGTVEHILWTEEMMNLVLETEFGSVEEGKRYLRDISTGVDVIGGLPDPKDTSVRHIPIPGQPYSMRLWTGHMDRSRTVSWNIVSNDTGEPMPKPKNLRMFTVDNTGNIDQPCFSMEVAQDLDKREHLSCETWCYPDGTVIEFVVGRKSVRRVRLPLRPHDGIPRVEQYTEHKILKIKEYMEGSGEEEETL